MTVKKSILCILAFIAFVNVLDAQTGCPSVTITSSSPTVDCDDPCITLEANPFETGSTSAYEVSSIPYVPPYPFNLGTQLFVGIDDIYSGVLDLPFEFCYFGNSYDAVVVCSNGSISFNTALANQYCPWAFNVNAPSANLPLNSIFGVYHDIDPSVCGQVRYQVLGIEPCRTFVLSYNAVCHFSCGGLQSTTQIVLYETTNTIDVYIQNKPTCGGWNGGRALCGIQNNNGTVAYVPPGRNTGAWTTSNEAWRFTPSGGEPTYEVSWYENGAAIGTGNSIDVCPSEAATYTAEAVYSGCGGNTVVVDDSIDIDVDLGDDPPNPTITNAQDFCISDLTFEFATAGDNGEWTASCGACINQNGVFDILAAGPGEHEIGHTLEGDCGPVTSTIVVEVIQDPDPEFSMLEEVCSSVAEVQPVPTQAGGSFSATCGDCIDELTGAFDPSQAGVGIHTVTYAFEGDCPTSSNQAIEVILQSNAEFTIPDQVCENAGEVIPDFTQSNGTWSADCGNCIDSNTGSFDPAVAGGGTFTITHTFDTFCPDDQSVDIIVIPVTAPVIESIDALCNSDAPVTLSASPVDGVWSATCGNCINANTGVFDPLGLTAGWYTVTYTIEGDCEVSDELEIEVLPQRDATINDPGVLCTGEGSVMLTAAETGGLWSASCVTCINGSNGSFDPLAAGAGEHTITYNIDDPCGDEDSIVITVEQSVDATLVEPGSYCLGFGEVAVQFAESGGVFSATCGDCINAETGVFNTLISGIGQHTITYTFDQFCGDTDEVVLTVTPNDPSTITADEGYCVDAGGQAFTAATPGGVWSATCTNCISPLGIFNPFNAGVGVHEITYSLPPPCGTTSTVEVEVYPLPIPTFTVDQAVDCAPHTVTFSPDSLQSVNCFWQFGDGTSSTSCGNAVHTYNTPGCSNVSLTMTTFNGCDATMTYNNMVCALQGPTSAFIYEPAQPTTDDPMIELQERASGAVEWEWIVGNEVFSTATDVMYNLLDHGGTSIDVCLRVTDVNGCTDLSCRNIELIETLRIFVPNAFTPDQDGVNEVWFPVVTGALSFEVSVYNRWGDKVFYSTTPGEPWLGEIQNGNHFGTNSVYTWHIKAIGEDRVVKDFTGHVILIR